MIITYDAKAVLMEIFARQRPLLAAARAVAPARTAASGILAVGQPLPRRHEAVREDVPP